MFHLAAYTALLGTTANTDITALADSVLNISNNHFRIFKAMRLLASWAASATLTRARLDSPVIRLYGNPFIRPVNVGVTPVDRGKIDYTFNQPLSLPIREEIALQATSGIAMGTERFTGLIWLSDGIDPIASTDAFTVRATSSTAATANAWSQLTLTLDSALPTGTYALLNSEHQSTNAIAHRWIIPGQVLRPGFLSITSEGNMSPWANYDGRWGECGRFINDNLPIPEVLANGADATHVFYLTLQRVAG